jgi:PhnB protein
MGHAGGTAAADFHRPLRDRELIDHDDKPKETQMAAIVEPIPQGFHTITPHIVTRDANAAIEFYKKAFGAVEMGRMPAPDNPKKLMHAMVRIGDSIMMLVDEFPEMQCVGPASLGGTAVTMHLYVKDVDAAVKQAEDAGAKVVMPVADMFWGDRYGRIVDPFGHSWSIATHKREMTPEQMHKEMLESCGAQTEKKSKSA